MSIKSLINEDEFIFDQVVIALKRYFIGRKTSFLEIRRHVYIVLLTGLKNESEEFFLDFAKAKLPEKKRKSIQLSNDEPDEETKKEFVDAIKENIKQFANENKENYKKIVDEKMLDDKFLEEFKNPALFKLGQSVLGEDCLKRESEQLLTVLNTNKQVHNLNIPYLPNFTGLYYFLYFSMSPRERLNEKNNSPNHLIEKPEYWRQKMRRMKMRILSEKTNEEPVTQIDKAANKAYQEFHETYSPADYNGEFMEEGSTKDKYYYGVSRFVITETACVLYYQELSTGEIVASEFVVSELSPATCFFLNEVDPKWGFQLCLPRPSSGGIKDFWILYQGSREQQMMRYTGAVYCQKTHKGIDKLMPVRRVEALDAHHLRVVEDINGLVQEQAEMVKNEILANEAYQKLFDTATEITEATEKSLAEITKLLNEKGQPIEIDDSLSFH